MHLLVGLAAWLLSPASVPPEAPPECPQAELPMACLSEGGSNYRFLFAYSAEASAIPALDAMLREAERTARENFEYLLDDARRFPDARYYYEETYTTDADRPELLALAVRHSEYAGGARAASTAGTLIWDRAANRAIDFEQLFVDFEGARALVNRQFCAALRDARDRTLGGPAHDDCPNLYFARLIAGTDGRIARLHFSFDPIDGTDEGQFDVELPVAAELVPLVGAAYRPAFVASDGPVTACHRASPRDPCFPVASSAGGDREVSDPRPQ